MRCGPRRDGVEAAGPVRAPGGARVRALALLVALAACGGPAEGGAGAPPGALAYPTNPAAYTVGTPVVPNVPSNGGGAARAWTVAPPLPAGLALDPSTGTVSGTPAAVAPAATYAVTASNRAGSATVGLEISVEAALAPPALLTYATNPAVYALGVEIPPNAPSSEGGPAESYTVSPHLPDGLTLDAGSGVVSGSPAALAPAAVHTVIAANGAGSASCLVSIAVLPAGSVWMAPQAAWLTTRTALLFTAGIAGGGGSMLWSASAGTVDGGGLFTAPRLPGPVTVMASRADAPASFATAAVDVSPRSTGNIEITLAEPTGDVIAGGELRVSASVVSRYWLERVEADLDGLPVPLVQGDDGRWSGEADVSALPDGAYWLRVAAIDFPGAETELFRKMTLVGSPGGR